MNLRQKKALETKRKISDKAIELFNEKGFNNVTVDEIVEKTSTSKGAFYNHFNSKHDIFSEKFREIDEFYVVELVPKLKEMDSVVLKLKFFLSMQMTFIEENLGWDVIRTIYEQELNTERESFFLVPDRPLYQILNNLFEEGRERNEFLNDYTSKQMLIIIVQVMRGVLYDWSINKGDFSLKNAQETLFEVVIKGFSK